MRFFYTLSRYLVGLLFIFSGVIKTREDLCLGKAKFEYVFSSKGFIFPRFLYDALLKSYEKTSFKSKSTFRSILESPVLPPKI